MIVTLSTYICILPLNSENISHVLTSVAHVSHSYVTVSKYGIHYRAQRSIELLRKLTKGNSEVDVVSSKAVISNEIEVAERYIA